MLVTQIKIPLRPIAVPMARFSLTLAMCRENKTNNKDPVPQ